MSFVIINTIIKQIRRTANPPSDKRCIIKGISAPVSFLYKNHQVRALPYCICNRLGSICFLYSYNARVVCMLSALCSVAWFLWICLLLSSGNESICLLIFVVLALLDVGSYYVLRDAVFFHPFFNIFFNRWKAHNMMSIFKNQSWYGSFKAFINLYIFPF